MYTCEPTHILLYNTFSTIQSNKIKFIEAVYRRRTDNTLANRKRTKGQTAIYKTIHTKKIELSKSEIARVRQYNVNRSKYPLWIVGSPMAMYIYDKANMYRFVSSQKEYILSQNE